MMDFGKASACLPVFAAVALYLAAGTAARSQDETYLTAYSAYNAALKAGDGAAATRHALSAWQAAEQALGDDRLTAILAYNYGRLVLFDNTNEARTALQRARELHETGVADLSANHVRLYSNYAEFAADGYTRRQADALRESLQAFGPDGAEDNPDLATMWLRLATHDVMEERYFKARESAASAEAVIRRVAPDSTYGLAEAILLGAVARLAPYPRTAEDVRAAQDGFDRAIRLFPPQKDLDNFDPLLAKLLAWDKAADSARETLAVENDTDGEDAETEASPPRPPLFEYQQDASVDCGEIEWLERKAPHYPSRALREGTIGAVFLGYQLGEDLKVRDARVLAEVPIARFGDAAVQAITEWQAKELPTGGPECYRNLTTWIMFMIER